MPPLIQHALEAEIVEQTPEAFECRVKQCLWAKMFREEEAGDIGYAIVCYPDYAVARGLNPRLQRGARCCGRGCLAPFGLTAAHIERTQVGPAVVRALLGAPVPGILERHFLRFGRKRAGGVDGRQPEVLCLRIPLQVLDEEVARRESELSAQQATSRAPTQR